jgi:hypothetical protein
MASFLHNTGTVNIWGHSDKFNETRKFVLSTFRMSLMHVPLGLPMEDWRSRKLMMFTRDSLQCTIWKVISEYKPQPQPPPPLIIKFAGLNWTQYTYQKCSMMFWSVLYQVNGNGLKTSNTGRYESSSRVKSITLINFKKSLTKIQTTDEKITWEQSISSTSTSTIEQKIQYKVCAKCYNITVAQRALP